MVDFSDRYVDPREWTVFPPIYDRIRLEEYQTYQDLLMGNHREVFVGKGSKHARRSETALLEDALGIRIDESCDDAYIVSNYCGVATRTFANILFGKPPKFKAADSNSTAQKRPDQIVIDNMLDITNHQQEVEASSLGDAVYRVRWGRMNNWRKEGVVIEAVPASVYYPILSPGNVKDNQGAVLAFEVEEDDNCYLYKEIHTPGEIRYELWALSGEKVGNLVPLDSISTYEWLPELAKGDNGSYSMDQDAVVYKTGYSGLFIEHVPNWTKPDRYFGISDYTPDIITNQGALNSVNTGILRTCLKHMDPKLALPPGTLEYDETTGKFFVKRSDLEAIEVPEEVASSLPRYITWDAKLDAATLKVDACFESMMTAFGLSPAIFGWEKYGIADSAAALKLRMTQTLWYIGQKRMYFDAALKNVLYAAQYLDGKFGPVKYEPKEVSITWPDPLPRDVAAEAQTLATMKNAQLISEEAAVSRIQEIEGQPLEDELEKIRLDNRAKELLYITQVMQIGGISQSAIQEWAKGTPLDEAMRMHPAIERTIIEDDLQ